MLTYGLVGLIMDDVPYFKYYLRLNLSSTFIVRDWIHFSKNKGNCIFKEEDFPRPVTVECLLQYLNFKLT